LNEVPMPPRIAALPRDSRGYPIPWNVMRDDAGDPIFTVNDSVKHVQALTGSLCPICGQPHDGTIWFIGGPRSAFDPNGFFLDAPAHEDCLEYALQTCPYLGAPLYVSPGNLIERNKSKVPAGTALVDHTQDPNRPEMFVMVESRGTLIYPRDSGLWLRPNGRLRTRFWRNGQQLAEIEGLRIVRDFYGYEPELSHQQQNE
jgi:hypothetical protein